MQNGRVVVYKSGNTYRFGVVVRVGQGNLTAQEIGTGTPKVLKEGAAHRFDENPGQFAREFATRIREELGIYVGQEKISLKPKPKAKAKTAAKPVKVKTKTKVAAKASKQKK